MPWYKQSGAFQRRAAVNHQLRWPFARGDGELPLLKAGKSTILGPKPPESGECRLKAFCTGERGHILERGGRPKDYRYRFFDPMIQSYVITRGIAV